MRYVGLAKSLVSAGHSVSLAARSFDTNLYSPKLNFVAVHNMYKMFVTMLKSDVMVLHGGGPFILISAILVSFLGKRLYWMAMFPTGLSWTRLPIRQNQVSFYPQSLRLMRLGAYWLFLFLI